jgi:hypothetical protein
MVIVIDEVIETFLPWLLECILVEPKESPQGSMEALDNTLSVVVTWFCDAPLYVVALEERSDTPIEELGTSVRLHEPRNLSCCS